VAPSPSWPSRLTEDSVASDASVAFVVQRGHVIWQYARAGHDPDALLHTASTTKFVVGLCVAHAVYTKRIASLSTPASHWLTEWESDDRRTITLRHLMTHTSGLAVEWPPADEFLVRTEDALGLDLVTTPGERVAYNNHGAQAVAEILRRATGQPVDEYAAVNLFAPIGIVDWAWNNGADGLPFGMSALQLRARDLGRVGELSLARGEWNGRRLFAADWGVDERDGSQPFGLLEMLVPEVGVVLDCSGAGALEDPVSDVVRCLEGMELPLNGAGSLWARLSDAVGPARVNDAFAHIRAQLPNLRFRACQRHAYGHTGSGGQYLWVVPGADAVAVRMRAFDERTGSPETADGFTELALNALLGGGANEALS